MVSTNKKAAPVYYASLAIYAKRNMAAEIAQALNTSPSFVGEKRGNFSWICSTQGDSTCSGIEQHLQLLKRRFGGVTDELIRFANEGCEIRIWVYFGMNGINGAFVLEPEFLAWLASFSADICIDVWS